MLILDWNILSQVKWQVPYCNKIVKEISIFKYIFLNTYTYSTNWKSILWLKWLGDLIEFVVIHTLAWIISVR